MGKKNEQIGINVFFSYYNTNINFLFLINALQKHELFI